MKIYVLLLIISVFNMTFLSTIQAGYPFGSAHPFNERYAKSRYSLGYINFKNVPEHQTLRAANKTTDQSGLFLVDTEITSNPIRIEGYNHKIGLIFRENEKTPRDTITFYLMNEEKKTGEKIIISVAEFEKYITQSWKYNNLPGPSKNAQYQEIIAIEGFIFNIAFDVTHLNQLQFISLEYRSPQPKSYDIYISNISSWANTSKFDCIQYKDLFDKKIIQILPMTATDIEAFNKK